ncbi:uncharacterized protein LOC130804559 [Amaranthus tricolor]|uniref:uncharacterized protein LOC130804559 n=1 Tax=Amaranthus tricolor TaxID=29722 RepID=UPI00258B6766|nr:uncharacterized protein LOC130804559 [Amaranthus tricolor]
MENPSQPKTALQELHQPLPTLDDFKNNTVDHTQDCSKCKTLGTPDRLKLPKPFKYPERYTSPTDHIISPISKGILARSRRGSALLPPTKIHSKIHELRSHKPVAKSELQMTETEIQGLV